MRPDAINKRHGQRRVSIIGKNNRRNRDAIAGGLESCPTPGAAASQQNLVARPVNLLIGAFDGLPGARAVAAAWDIVTPPGVTVLNVTLNDVTSNGVTLISVTLQFVKSM